jgi:Activator of Hsp90 ATPase homolog 1-like protein
MKMKSRSFAATIEVAKAAQKVFTSITDVGQWWTNDFEGSSENLNEEFVIHHPGQHYSKQKLVEVVPNKKVVWLVTDSTLYWLQKDQHEWTGTKMIFEITTAGNKTIISFTHEGLTPEKECYALCEQGWDLIIRSWLYYFITYGTPSPDMTMSAEIRAKALGDMASPK